MKKLFYTLIVVGLFASGCESSDETIVPSSQRENIPTKSLEIRNKSACSVKSLTVKEFISMVKSECSKDELTFLQSLPDSMKLHLYPDSYKKYFKKFEPNKMNGDIITLLCLPPEKVSISTSEVLPSTRTSDFVYREGRTIKVDAVWFSSLPQIPGYPDAKTSKLRLTIIYDYDYMNHEILSVIRDPICDLIDIGGHIDSALFAWRDLGTWARDWGDHMTIEYMVLGDVVAGIVFKNYPIGFTKLQVRGNTGQTLVPYD